MKKFILFICVLTLVSCKTKAPVTTSKKPKKLLTYTPPKEENKTIIVTDSVAAEKTKTTKSRYSKVSISEAGFAKENLAQSLGARLLESCSTSKFQPYSTKEVTQTVLDNTTIEKVTAVCRQINARNGAFKSLTLLDITRDGQTDSYVFRYNIEFEKTYFQRELFVTINADGKMASLKTKEIPKGPM